MNKAMYAAASGMSAEQQHLDVISGNLANAEEIGFKGSEMEFAALTDGSQALGSSPRGMHVRFEQGKLMKSGGAFDLAIDGAGFFVLHRTDGTALYTRDGRFTRSSDGHLRANDGNALAGIVIPADAVNATVERDGRVFADTGGTKHTQIGRIAVAVFAAPDALRSIGGTAFLPTAASGPARTVVAGTHGAGTFAFGMLEKSNVSIMETMMEILSAQRAFEADSKGVQAADEMQRIANNIART